MPPSFRVSARVLRALSGFLAAAILTGWAAGPAQAGVAGDHHSPAVVMTATSALAAQYVLAANATAGTLTTYIAARDAAADSVAFEMGLDPAAVCDGLVGSRATALLLLVGHPEPAVSIVKAVRRDPRLGEILIGAPAGQPEFGEWATLLGDDGAAIPFLRYLPERLSPLGARVATALRERLAEAPSFVAFEGYDTIAVLAEILSTHGADRRRIARAWPRAAVDGTRGRITFSRPPGSGVWQWADPPIQVVDRDPADLDRFRILHTARRPDRGSPLGDEDTGRAA